MIELGQTVMTAGVSKHVADHTQSILPSWQVRKILTRHQSGDWGDLDDEDKAANDQAVEYGNRILSAYKLYGEKVWVITERDRSVTTLLFPSEY